MTTEKPDPAALLPCPFCGGAASGGRVDDRPVWWVQCTQCKAEVAPTGSKAEAIAAWNTRAALQPQGPTADDAAVLSELFAADDAVRATPGTGRKEAMERFIKARAAVLARMSVKVPPQWTPCSTDDHAQGYAAGFNACREQVLQSQK